MTTLLLVFAVLSLVVVPLAPRLGSRVFLVAALAPAAAFAWTLAQAPAVLRPGGEVRQHVEYLPALGLDVDLRLDALGWAVALVVTGVGAVVMLYCVRYFRDDEPALGPFAGAFTAFAGSMLGLVLADGVYLLFVFWEATSVFSYLLIGHASDRRASRGAALQALLVTTLGGLAMLVGLVLLQSVARTATLSGLLAHPPPLTDPLVVTGIALVIVGAVSKSALVPLHFWLPGAMAAPTPVSAYLHAAAMVKAGVYLVLRLAPAFAATPGWRESLVTLGVMTMLLGGWRALREHDLKLVLAGGTVAQLGLLMIVACIGTRATGTAALVLLIGHALFKSTLFLVTGVVDHAAGTRDLRRLSGLGRRLPVLAAAAALAAASMAGVPPLLGFVAKEGVLAALLEPGPDAAWRLVALGGVVAGSVLTVAYALRFLWGAFGRKPGVAPMQAHPEKAAFLAPPALLAVAGLVLGVAPALAEPAAAAYGALLPGAAAPHLALWHGPTLELGLSAATLAAGVALFAARGPVAALQTRLHPRRDAEDVYRAVLRRIDRTSAQLTSRVQRGSLPFYLGVILTVFVCATTVTMAVTGTIGVPALVATTAQTVAAAVMSVAAVAAAVAGKRFQAVVLTGITGFGMAVLFALQGAPDLALTQVLVDLVTLIAFVLVLRRLPPRLGVAHRSTHPAFRIVLGVAVGAVMSVIVLTATAARTAQPVSVAFPRLALTEGHGANVVNVALVDIRGWDTMGELSVLIAAATGVASLVFLAGRGDALPAVQGLAKRRPFRRRGQTQEVPGRADRGRTTWLLAGRTLRPENRSILLEVVVRLTFHAVVVLSVYLLFAGHNAPGGGFAGGLVAGLALTGRYLAAGRFELGIAAPLNAGVLLGVGLLLAAGAAIAPLLVGADALTSAYLDLDLGVLGHLALVSSTVFDIGVYLVVVGVVLDVLRSLGAELDRQYEEEGEGAA